jgi:hypothetical protein
MMPSSVNGRKRHHAIGRALQGGDGFVLSTVTARRPSPLRLRRLGQPQWKSWKVIGALSKIHQRLFNRSRTFQRWSGLNAQEVVRVVTRGRRLTDLNQKRDRLDPLNPAGSAPSIATGAKASEQIRASRVKPLRGARSALDTLICSEKR